jgi:hypothetical protein
MLLYLLVQPSSPARAEEYEIVLPTFDHTLPLLSSYETTVDLHWAGVPVSLPLSLSLGLDSRGRIAASAGPCTLDGKDVDVKGSLRPADDLWGYSLVVKSKKGAAEKFLAKMSGEFLGDENYHFARGAPSF